MQENDKHKEKLAEKISDADWQEAFYKKTVLELQTEPRFVTYFSQFSPDSVETFITDYASRKTAWHFYEYKFGNMPRKREKRGIKGAWDALRLIQQKKLFDVICRWGNNEISLPGIEITDELVNWDARIFECPYLEPVSQIDMDLYQSYLHDLVLGEKLDYHTPINMSFYQFLVGKEDIDHSPWFRYYDAAIGSKPVLLPVPRTVKEFAYRNAGNPPVPAEPKPAVPPPQPKLSFYNYRETFIRKFEDSAFRKLYAAAQKEQVIDEFTEHIESDLEYLSETEEPVAVDENDDWRVAIAEAGERHTRRLISEELPVVFEEYQARLISGKGFPGWKNAKPKTPEEIGAIKQKILKGRALAGEPADFNY